jgi:hypothetical protein
MKNRWMKLLGDDLWGDRVGLVLGVHRTNVFRYERLDSWDDYAKLVIETLESTPRRYWPSWLAKRYDKARAITSATLAGS